MSHLDDSSTSDAADGAPDDACDDFLGVRWPRAEADFDGFEAWTARFTDEPPDPRGEKDDDADRRGDPR